MDWSRPWTGPLRGILGLFSLFWYQFKDIKAGVHIWGKSYKKAFDREDSGQISPWVVWSGTKMMMGEQIPREGSKESTAARILARGVFLSKISKGYIYL